MSGLTAEDLSFFDTHKKEEQNGNAQAPAELMAGLSIGGSAPSAKVADQDDDDDDDDDFGDFVGVDEPASSLQPTQAPLHIEQEKPKPTSSPSSNIQSSMEDFKAPQQIRFGQHFHNNKLTSATAEQWNNVLASRPGPSQHKTPPPAAKPKSKSPPKFEKPVVVQPQLVEDPEWAYDDDEEYGNGEENNTAQSQSDISNSSYNASHTSTELLVICHEQVLPLVETLLQGLSQLSYQLRKRVLSHTKTKTFIKAYVEMIYVVSRVMAGRKRRCVVNDKCDREARQVERVWETLSLRLKSVLAADQIPKLDSKIVYESSEMGDQLCMVCGLRKVEFIKGQPKPKWSNTGHNTCIKWYNNFVIAT